MKKDKKTSIIDNFKIFGLRNFLPHVQECQDKIVESVKSIGGKGEITIKLTYKMNGHKAVEVNPKVTYKMPARGLQAISMFPTKDGRLADEDPDQVTIDDVEFLEEKKPENVTFLNKANGE